MAMLYAVLAAVFASLTSILAKIGLQNSNANIVTALRCVIVVFCSFILIYFKDLYEQIFNIEPQVYIFLMLSGIFTCASWLLYFNALKVGQVSQIAPIDSSSIVITILLSWILLGERVNIFKIWGIFLVFIGLLFIVYQKTDSYKVNNKAIIYAFLSAISAACSSITGKIGIIGVDSILGTTIRLFVVLIFSWLIVYVRKDYTSCKFLTKKAWLFIILSGLSSGFSWFSFYRALQLGELNEVVAIDKTSILFTMIFSALILKEKIIFTKIIGLILLVVGVFFLV